MDLAELLPLYALGALDDAEAAEVARAVAADPALAAELETLLTASVDLAAAAPGLAPSPAVRDRLLASVDTRFERFVARMSELFDVAADRARELFRLIDRKDAWEPGPTPGSWLIHFTAGPALAGADTGFVRLAPGERFAWHRHTATSRTWSWPASPTTRCPAASPPAPRPSPPPAPSTTSSTSATRTSSSRSGSGASTSTPRARADRRASLRAYRRGRYSGLSSAPNSVRYTSAVVGTKTAMRAIDRSSSRTYSASPRSGYTHWVASA
jgi:hypothetical protein